MSTLAVAAITHADAPLNVLERVSYVGDDVGAALRKLRAQAGVREAAIVATCNRTEIYSVLDGPAEASRLGWFMAEDRGVCWGVLRSMTRLHSGDDAAAHLFRVAAGVESLSFGEAEIIAQIKAVHAELAESGQVELLGLFEAAIRAGRAVRRDVNMGEAGASLGAAAVTAATRALGGAPRRTLLVGAGKIARSVVDALAPSGDLVVVSRTLQSAENLAGATGRAAPMSALAEELAAADAVFFCASSRTPLLDADAADAITAHRSFPLVLIDLGLPRNVAAEVRRVDRIELVDLDGLRRHVNSPARIRTLTEVDPLIAWEVARYRSAQIARSVAPLIEGLRTRFEELAAAALDEAFGDAGSERERAAKALRRAHGKVLHDAISEARRAALAGENEVLSALERAFGLAPTNTHTHHVVDIGPRMKEEVA
ncbi:MAG: glutamyl-tRNA reductase [Actinomycetota bacterium]